MKVVTTPDSLVVKAAWRASRVQKFEKTRNAATATPHMEDAWQMLTMRGKPHNAPRLLTHRAHTAQLTELHHVALKALNGLKLKGNENFNWRWRSSPIGHPFSAQVRVARIHRRSIVHTIARFGARQAHCTLCNSKIASRLLALLGGPTRS